MKSSEFVVSALDIIVHLRKDGYRTEGDKISMDNAIDLLKKALEVLKRGRRKAG